MNMANANEIPLIHLKIYELLTNISATSHHSSPSGTNLLYLVPYLRKNYKSFLYYIFKAFSLRISGFSPSISINHFRRKVHLRPWLRRIINCMPLSTYRVATYSTLCARNKNNNSVDNSKHHFIKFGP